MSSSAHPPTQGEHKTKQRLSQVKHYLVCYSGIKGHYSRRWHRFLRTCGQRQMNGVYLIESRPQITKKLQINAQEITKDGGTISIYPLCSRCHTHSLHFGGQPPKSNVPYYIV